MSEQAISIHDIFDARQNGKLQEVFGTGTAAVISPVGELKYGDQAITIGDGNVGPLANRLLKTVTDIQMEK